jgi:hypothetical protein
MDRSNQVTLIIATAMLVFAVSSPFVFPELWGGGFEGFFAGMCFFVVFFVVGLTVLIVGLARGGQRQQQQQQVVVLGAGGVPVAGTTATTRVRCATCQHLNPAEARFCTQCATYIGRKTA